jgi:NADH-quinone oxidoreductase subunit G/NADP-reducing hydrogenase subunit HndD
MKIKINDHLVEARVGQTILEVAQAQGIDIPVLCYHPDLSVKANCRICVVEIKDQDRLVTACSTSVQAGMEIFTDSLKVKRARNLNLELIFGEHTKKCSTCSSLYNCQLLKLAKKYKLKTGRFAERKTARPTYRFAQAVEIDGSQCIDCSNCVEACDRQGIGYLKLAGAGINQEIVPLSKAGKVCVYCGQCANACPVAAAQESSAVAAVEKILADPTKVTVAQFAPAVRVSLGEEFGLPYGTNCEGQIYTALKKLGFQHVTDINFGADITTMTEATELVARLADKQAIWPLTTSCCPAWVAYVEHYHPELIPNLTSARSPHIHSAGAIKTFWAEHYQVDAKKIVVVSVVPCTAKKYEAGRAELNWQGQPLVDYVLTTRELAYLIKKRHLDFKHLAPTDGDTLFNHGSGAAAIYGASGGVMESALRTASFLLNANKERKTKSKSEPAAGRLEFTEVRGLAGFKEATFTLGSRKLKVGVVSGLANLAKVLPKFKKYHYIEVMACPGGCLSGGGQPLPTTNKIRQQRLQGLYQIDKSRQLRRAHENQAMLDYYHWVQERHLEAKLLHTKFKATTGSVLTVKRGTGKSVFNIFS